MAYETATDNARFIHRKDGYTVTVEHSAPQGVTLFRRDVGLPVKVGTIGSQYMKPIAKLRTKKTVAFLKEFGKVAR